VPKLSNDAHKMNRQGAVLTFLTRYHEEGGEMFDHIVTVRFWDRKGVFLVEFMQIGTMINSAVYYKT